MRTVLRSQINSTSGWRRGNFLTRHRNDEPYYNAYEGYDGCRQHTELTQEHMIMEASIQGINDSYLVIVGIGILGLLLSFFIKRVGQAPDPEQEPEVKLKKIITKEA